MVMGCVGGYGGGCEVRDMREEPSSTWAERTGGIWPGLPWG